ncbi:pilus assembly protein TadG-related protein [Nocardioides sp. Kera G14]|uniref:pilus assembly protein TadG-related protein n=1 Tax=Nocardioides sp. Kera G14 TaxID=2884264 RepID=UPI0022391F56|nr:pilus assembly protein TadG-related protein [Nocardioides sp. Kera G14]
MAIMTAVFLMAVMIPIAGLAVDIGMQRVGRSDAQALADSAAQDAARVLGNAIAAGTTSNTSFTGSVTDAAVSAVASQSGYVGSSAPVVKAYLGVLSAGTHSSDQSLGCDGNPFRDSYFQSAGTGVPNAVLVTVSNNVKFSFNPGSGAYCRSALATSDGTACFRLGSYAARLATSNSALFTSLLNGALGNISIDAASYQGLASASIPLGPLATQLGVGTVDQLSSASVQMSTLMIAAAQVLRDNGDTVNANILDTIRAATHLTTSVPVGSILNIATGNGAALGASINALDLISGGAFVANGTNLLSIPALAANLGATGTNLTTSLKLIEAAQQACGRVGTQASTSQASISIKGTLADVSTPSGLTGLALSVGAGSTDISLDLASATGTLTNIVCGTGTVASPQGIDVSVASKLVSTTVTQNLDISGGITSSGILGNLLGSLLGGIVKVEVGGSIKLTLSNSKPAATSTASLRIPISPTTYSNGVSTGSGTLGLSSLAATVDFSGLTLHAYTGVLGIGLFDATLSLSQQTTLINNLVSSVMSGIVSPLLANVESNVLRPVEELLGLEVPGAEVFAVPSPTCDTPLLVG